MSEIRARFERETAEHEMTVLHDDGLYRHLRFRAPSHGMYWFDLITVPGSLIFQGDGESFVFRRIEDMFDFFRGPIGRINPHYWSEKLTDGEDRVMRYDRELFEACVRQDIAGRDDLPGLADAVQDEILDSEDLDYEESARRVVDEFRFYRNEADRHGGMRRVDGVMTWVPAKAPDFEFHDTWEWGVRDYHWWYLWALHAIVWGIAQYDASRGHAVAGQLRTLQVAGERL